MTRYRLFRLTQKMQRLVWALLLVPLASVAGRAENFIADLSEREIAITSNFHGQTLTLFGSINPEGPSLTQGDAEGGLNLVAVVRGPARPVVVRQKSRLFGIWMNTDAVTFPDVPVFFYVASYFEDVTPALKNVLRRYQLTPESLRFHAQDASLSPEEEAAYKQAIIRIRARDDLFVENYGSIDVKETLFRTEIVFPANVPVGNYNAEIYLIRGNRVIAQSETLYINKTGIGRMIYELAMEDSFIYGIFTVVVAFFAGWLAWLVMRRE